MRVWRPALGVTILLVLGFWDARMPSQATLPTQSGSASAATATADPQATNAPGVLRPKGKPDFSVTFSGTRLDTKVWNTCYPAQDTPAGCTNYGNREYEWYLPGQVTVSGGVLHLTAQRKVTIGVDRHGARKVYQCRSGMVTSYPGFQFKYGYLQVVARIPDQPGSWSALWLEAANLHWPPEIDILENWATTFSSSYLHAVGGHVSRQRVPQDLVLGWHVFSLSWTKSQLTWLVDGRVVFTVRQRIPHQPMFFLADLAEYRQAKPGFCTGSLLIRSVKVWKA